MHGLLPFSGDVTNASMLEWASIVLMILVGLRIAAPLSYNWIGNLTSTKRCPKKLCHAAHVKSQKCTRNAELAALAPRYRRQETDFYKTCFEKFSSYEEYKNSAHDLCEAIDQLNVWRRQYQVPEFEVPTKNLCDSAQAWSQTMAKEMKLKHAPQSIRNGQGL